MKDMKCGLHYFNQINVDEYHEETDLEDKVALLIQKGY